MYPLFLKCLVRYKTCNNYPKISMSHLQYMYIDREYKGGLQNILYLMDSINKLNMVKRF